MQEVAGMSIVRRAKPLLGTLVDIAVRAEDAQHAQRALASAFAELATVHRLMSFHDSESDVSRINRAAVGAPTRVDSRTAEVLRAARCLSVESQGVFDCTVARELVQSGLLPAAAQNVVPLSGDTPADPWSLEGDLVVKSMDCLIDLGGIAKGYAVDRATAVLAQYGVADALVNAGGDLRHHGETPATIHLRDPADPGRIGSATSLLNAALASSATSGLNAKGTSAVSALIDGVTRLPLPLGEGASIIAPSCMMADALTKFVLAVRATSHPLLDRHRARVVFYRFAGP
ncbi:ApbE-like lipoprotein [Pandoraea terrae]|uniref:FAD:protein FMN transferase n=1 Tax=Pandoraea terrae TaxID=1537710 RepID=A0A5E4S9G1_9BURK|nr:ApbE-like lipoprotein [Pandoraea terrae]